MKGRVATADPFGEDRDVLVRWRKDDPVALELPEIRGRCQSSRDAVWRCRRVIDPVSPVDLRDSRIFDAEGLVRHLRREGWSGIDLEMNSIR